MSALPPSDDPVAPAPPVPRAEGVLVSRPVVYTLVVVSGVALVAAGLLWQRLGGIQEQLARQSGETLATAVEARTLARQAQDLARDNAARVAINESKLGEVALQRSQLEDLMQSLSRSRDENLVIDIESSLRLAQQQAQLSLSAEPLLAALRAADLRLARAGQPRLARLRAAVTHDMERVKAASVTDVPGLLARFDELTRLVDDLPVANAVGAAASAQARRDAPPPADATWWEKALAAVRDEARGLVRVSRIDQPEAALLTPGQAFFLRENLKLRLLNARLSLLARQTDLARADAAAAANALFKYFDPAARRTQAAASLLQQLQSQLRTVELPRIDETMALLDATAAGK